MSLAVEPFQMERQLSSIDKWFVPRKRVTFYFMIVTVACLVIPSVEERVRELFLLT